MSKTIFLAHTGTQLVGGLQVMACFFSICINLIFLLIGVTSHDDKAGPMIGWTSSNLFGNIIFMLATILMLVGLSKRKPNFYVPYLIMTILGIIGLLISMILFFVLAIVSFTGASEERRPEDEKVGGVAGGIFALIITFFLGIFTIGFFYLAFVVPNRSRKLLESDRIVPVVVNNITY